MSFPIAQHEALQRALNPSETLTLPHGAFGLKLKRTASILCQRTHRLKKSHRRMRQIRVFAVDQPKRPLDLQLFYRDFDQHAGLKLRLDGETRRKGDSVAAGNKSLDRLKAR